MAYYLSMDGVDDYILTPSLTYDEVILDILVNPSGFYKTVLQSNNGTYRLIYDEGYYIWYYESTVYWNGVQKGDSGSFTLPANTRGVWRMMKDSQTTTNALFATMGGGGCMAGNLYRVTFKLAGSVVADYDMTTGNVNDVSGNGKHATLTGGTWVNDTPSGTNYPVNLSDTVTLSETFRKSASKSYIDTLTLSESFSKKRSMVILDTVSLSDSESDKASRIYSDTVTLSDSMSSIKGKGVFLSDTLVITDTLRKVVGKLQTDSVSLADSDSQNIIKAFSDSLALSETISTMKGKAVYLSDSLNVTDSIKKAIGKLEADSVSLSDSVSRRISVTARIYDVLLVSDSVQLYLPNTPSIVRVVEITGGIQAVIELRGEIVVKSSLPPISLEGDVIAPAELKGDV
jgi:hypothetical protein